MNPEPPPFGDPTNIRRENNAAISKGVAVGCGGCLMVVTALVFFIVAILGLVMLFLRGSEPCVETMRRAQKSPALQQALGEPMKMGWILTGGVSTMNDSGSADVSIPISGPKGSVRIHTRALREERVWNYKEMSAPPAHWRSGGPAENPARKGCALPLSKSFSLGCGAPQVDSEGTQSYEKR
ncbi:MAG: cytochrome c oxidase assembly factor Coa1 family protein [Verrucomicrobiota bacterium]